MASVIFFVNQKGEEVVARHFRHDVTKVALDAFRDKVRNILPLLKTECYNYAVRLCELNSFALYSVNNKSRTILPR